MIKPHELRLGGSADFWLRLPRTQPATSMTQRAYVTICQSMKNTSPTRPSEEQVVGLHVVVDQVPGSELNSDAAATGRL